MADEGRRNDPASSGGFDGVGLPASRLRQREDTYAHYVVPEIEVLLRVALSMTAQAADAEDLVQDTLLRAWRSLDTFDGRHPRAWLLTILRNAEVNRHRRRRPDLLDNPDDPPEQLGLEGHASAEDEVLARAFDAVVDAALAELSEPFRQAVLLVDADGLTYAEAAAVLGVPEGTVMSRLHRARKQVRDRLSAAGLARRRLR